MSVKPSARYRKREKFTCGGISTPTPGASRVKDSKRVALFFSPASGRHVEHCAFGVEGCRWVERPSCYKEARGRDTMRVRRSGTAVARWEGPDSRDSSVCAAQLVGLPSLVPLLPPSIDASRSSQPRLPSRPLCGSRGSLRPWRLFARFISSL